MGVCMSSLYDWVKERIDEVFVYKNFVPYGVLENIINLAVFHGLGEFNNDSREGDKIISFYWVNKEIFSNPYYLTEANIRSVREFDGYYGYDRATWLIVGTAIYSITSCLVDRPLNESKVAEIIDSLKDLARLMPTLNVREYKNVRHAKRA